MVHELRKHNASEYAKADTEGNVVTLGSSSPCKQNTYNLKISRFINAWIFNNLLGKHIKR